MNSMDITIRSIQHYMYCPHRWGLLEIDRAWAENVFVTKANLLHSRVHGPEQNYTSRGKKVYTSVSVYNDREPYGLYGVTDCIELKEEKQGVSTDGDKGKYSVCIVEYKPTKHRYEEFHEEDLMQVFAQKICVDYVFGCDCDAVIYYADVKKRIPLPLKENYEKYDCLLRKMVKEMRDYLVKGMVPEIRKGQKCGGCSMKDLCMPSASRQMDLMAEIRKIRKTEGEQE